MTRKTFLLALLATTSLSLIGMPAVAQGACLTPAEIQSLTNSRQIVSFPEVKARLSGTALSFDVCEEGGRLVYKIRVDEGGQARIITLNARTGQP